MTAQDDTLTILAGITDAGDEPIPASIEIDA
jgi:hypothetical protein